MKATIARLLLPPRWVGEPPWIEKRYPDRTFDFDTVKRGAHSEKHHDLFVLMGEDKRRFRCMCREDHDLEVTVRLRKPLPYLALMPRTSLQHDGECPFHRAPIRSHVLGAVEEKTDGSLHVRLNFHVGESISECEPAAPKETENELRTRRVSRQLNRFGLEGLLRLLFGEAGLHRWRAYYRPKDRITTDGWWTPTYKRLHRTLKNINIQGQSTGVLESYTQIGSLGTVATFGKGTVLAVIDVIEKVEAPKKGHNWKCYLAGWGKNFLIISPDQVKVLLRQLRFPAKRTEDILMGKEPSCARPTEVWWGCLLVRVEESDSGKWYWVLDQGVLRTDQRGIPAESLGEIEMTQHLIEQGRAFCKPLFPGELEAVSWRRPDFILEDTTRPCCIEVAGMDGFYDYADRDNMRLSDYDRFGVKYKRWKTGDPWPKFDAEFARVRFGKVRLNTTKDY